MSDELRRTPQLTTGTPYGAALWDSLLPTVLLRARRSDCGRTERQLPERNSSTSIKSHEADSDKAAAPSRRRPSQTPPAAPSAAHAACLAPPPRRPPEPDHQGPDHAAEHAPPSMNEAAEHPPLSHRLAQAAAPPYPARQSAEATRTSDTRRLTGHARRAGPAGAITER